MKRIDKRSIAKNVGSSWLGLIVNVAVGIVVSPYILHRLGDDAFGLWVLVFAVTGYYGLFDFGIRSSVVRYVAKFHATNDQEELNKLVSTSLASYSCIGLLLLALTAIASLFVDKLFHVSPSYMATARLLFVMVGTSLAVNFPMGVFSGTLEGLQKFYFINLVNITTTLTRAVLIIFFLHRGCGLLTVAFITVSLPIVNGIVNAINVFRSIDLRIGKNLVSRSTFRQIAHYSSLTFVISVAQKLRFKTDALVIGTFLSSAAITHFAIGSRLVDYAGEVVSGLAQIFVPMSSHSDAKGDLTSLRRILVAGNRACAMITFPMAAILIILGKSIIEAWVGKKYIAESYPVLLILIVPSTLMLAQSASGRILFGMAKHKTLAWVTMAEGIGNLVLSIALVRPYGIIGDALGTAIPLICSMIFFLPGHMCRMLGIRVRRYLVEAFLLPLGLCVPMAAVLFWLQQRWPPHGIVQLGLRVAVGLAIYGIGLLWVIWTDRAWRVGDLTDESVSNEVAVGLVETYQQEEV
jgi:O-antigen/teichoic acid export membrane protein